MSERYNGWSNYQTWNVHLWLSNDENAYRAWRRSAAECWEAADPEPSFGTRSDEARRTLADRIRDSVVDDHPLVDSPSMYSDCLTFVLQGVEWEAVADAFLESVDGYESTPAVSDD